LLLALLMLLGARTADGAAQKTHPYRTRWKHATVGKGALGRVAAGAGVAQLRKTPRKYGGGASGFGKRLGAGFATNAVKTTVEHGVAARLHEDLNYHRSTKHGVAPRLAHALTSTVVTRNTKSGKVARSVFVIDSGGVIRYRDVRPLGLFRPKDDDTIQAIRDAQK
jgi:hypothetical protein